MSNIFQYFDFLKPKAKDTLINGKICDVIVQPDNVCPRCSSDSGFRTNDSYFVKNWACKNCLSVWMTLPETHDNE